MHRCPKCNFELSERARFCNKCGLAQTDVKQASTSPAPPPSVPSTTPSANPPPVRTVRPRVKHTFSTSTAPPSHPVTHEPTRPTKQSPAQTASSQSEAQPVQPFTTPPHLASLTPSDPIPPPPASLSEEASPTSLAQKRSLPLIPPVPLPMSPVLRSPQTQPSIEEASPVRSRGFSLMQPGGGSQAWNIQKQSRQTEQEVYTPTASLPVQPPQKEKYQDPSCDEPSSLADIPTGQHPGVEASSKASSLIGQPLPELPRLDITLSDTMNLVGSESLLATSRAAEHWRESWRDRQRIEAGPAVGVSRGQASVAEPLLAMQNSLVRMRAILMPKTQKQRGVDVGFWALLVMMFCLIGGLGAYIASTYVSAAKSGAVLLDGAPQPTLTTPATESITIPAGQRLRVHGEHFGVNDTITFVLDNTLLTDTRNKPISVRSTKQGSFDATLHATWLAGAYILQAQDSRTGQHAFLDIQISPDSVNAVTTNKTSLLLQDSKGNAVSKLNFVATRGKGDLHGQRINLRNNGGAPLKWTTAVITNNNASWLLIDDGKTSGELNIGQYGSIGISVLSADLASGSYEGQVIFTVENQGQVMLSVSLQVQNSALEVVINPNPVIAVLTGGGTCQPTTLTLINLGGVPVTWAANPYLSNRSHIHLDNQPTEQGMLAPSGQPGDTVVLKISCIDVQLGEKKYHLTVSYNLNSGGTSSDVPISIRTAY